MIRLAISCRCGARFVLRVSKDLVEHMCDMCAAVFLLDYEDDPYRLRVSVVSTVAGRAAYPLSIAELVDTKSGG